MSKYTTEVRFICENKSGLEVSGGSGDVDNIIANSWNKIFTSKAPFFDEEYRSVLCQKILKHYYLREICCETVGIWILWMNTRLEEIMPYYNQLYESAKIKFNPMHDVDLTRKHERTGNETSVGSGTSSETTNDTNNVTSNSETNTTNNGTSSETGSSSVTSKGSKTQNTNDRKNKTDKYSDTPQGSISNLADNTYLTNARIIEDTTNGSLTEKDDGSNNASSKTDGTITDKGNNTTSYNENGTSTGTKTGNTTSNETVDTTENYLETVVGKQGTESFSSLLNKFRETFLNIDMQVIEEFSDLFFGLW